MENKFEHIMLDLETLDTRNTSAILSIAAVRFDIKSGKTNSTFRMNVDLQNCLELGMSIKSDTIYWWLKQPSEVGHRLSADMRPLKEVLTHLSYFIGQDDYVWGNSARFDLGILENAYDITQISKPWNYFNERDVRTLVSLRPEVKAQHVFDGQKHDPLDDCLNQIAYCSKIFNSLMGV